MGDPLELLRTARLAAIVQAPARDRAFPGVQIVAFGGIGSDSAPQSLERGASAVVVDQGLFPAEMDPQSIAVITMRASALVELCADVVVGERQSLA